jgi:hypothetical protein
MTLDGSPPFELALDLRRDAALLAGSCRPRACDRTGAVAATAGVGDAAVEHVADERLHLRNDRGERVPVIKVG